MVASKFALPYLSLSHFRPLSCAASSSASASYPSRLLPNPPDLIQWVRTEGGFVHRALNIALDANHSLGIFASENIERGSKLICIPDHLPLRFESPTPQSADGIDPVLVNLARQIPEELWAMKLGLKLLQERAKVGSFWWPYISNLPDMYTVPIFFQADDIKNLQYAPLLSQVNKRCRFLMSFEDEVKHVIDSLKVDDHPFSGQDVDASSLGWAMSAVSSRAFRLHGKNLSDRANSYVHMMLPLIDMCNHSFTPNAQIVQEQDAGPSKQVKVVAETMIKRNDQVLLNYGCLDNDLFLLDYGFIISSNPHDCIELKYDEALLDAASVVAGITSPNFAAPSQWQKQILIQLNLDGKSPSLKLRIGGSEVVEGRLLAALRVLLSSDEEEVQKHDMNKLKSLSGEALLGASKEIAALRTIIALCLIALSHFPSKIMEDEAMLKGNISDSTKLAIQYRIQKKSVIIDAMSNLTRRVKMLQSLEKASA